MNTIEETIEEKEMSEDNMVEHPYEPYLVKAPCWIGNGQIKYDYVPASFARHPCDLFDKNGKREEWKYLNEEEKSIKGKIETVSEDKNAKEIIKEHFKNLLPEKAEYLWKNIAGGIQVSSFGRVGIPINNKYCKGCNGCKLESNCGDAFHYILPQYEEGEWNETEQGFKKYNGYLVVDNAISKENDRLVYHLVAEAFKMKEDTLKKMEKGNKDFIDYIKEKCGYGDEENLKKAFKELKNADELQIHHINNNGHRNTPTYWDENGTMIKGNLIALPDSVHQKL